MRVRELRTVLAKAALRTPGIYYYSTDLAEEAPEEIRHDIRASLGLVAMDALRSLEPGSHANINYGTIYEEDIAKGGWKALVMRGTDTVNDPHPMPDDTQDANTEDLRAWISTNINQCQKTLIMDEDMFKDFPEKTSMDGDEMSPMSQGVMNIAIAYEPFLKIDEKAQVVFTLLTVGATEGAVFLIEIERTS